MRLCLLAVSLALCLLAAYNVKGTSINYVRDEGHDFMTLIKGAKGNFVINSPDPGSVYILLLHMHVLC